MAFHEDIQAFSRGELDHETILGRLRSYLSRPDQEPAELRDVLDAARRADEITNADYNLLTQCIVDESGEQDDADLATSFAPSSGQPATPSQLSQRSQVDDSMTRLATSIDLSTEDEGQSGVDVGARLRDRFILDEVIGVGGMGTVYRGRDVLKIEAQDRNPYVAIKILNDSFKERPDAFIVLQREASRQQRLAHPNIATVYDFDRTGSVMFITMEYLDGVSLDHYIKHDVRPNNGLKLPEALPIIEGMCAALSHAHLRSIVHADFKPGNCFITQNRQLKVLDFGIARAMKDPAQGGDETLFDPRSIGALTPAYASPEMLDNSEDADPRDDIYALACVTYELLSGRHPFHRIPADQAMANKLKPERIKHLTRRQNDALARALAFERSKRTPSVAEFLDGLSQTSGGFGGMKAALAVGVGGLVIAGALVLPGLLERWESEDLVAEIAAGRIEPVLAQLGELPRQQQQRVLQEGRPQIIDYYEQRFETLMAQPDGQVDFQGAERVLAESTELYPDSAALGELENRLNLRREEYLSQIAQAFEGYLEPSYLLPEGDDNLHRLIDRLQQVDPTNPLLEDSRIPGAYADTVEAALQSEEYGRARSFLDAGLALAPADANLADLRDRVQAEEQRIEREATIADLAEQVRNGVADADGLAAVEALLPTINELRRLAPDHPAIAEAGASVVERFTVGAQAAGRAATLPEVEAYLADAAPVWTALGQGQMVEPVEARRAALVAQQEELVGLTREAIRQPDMRAGGRSAAELVAQVRAIDPSDPRPDILQSELVQSRRQRAEQLMLDTQWEAARAELAALSAVPLSAEQRGAVAEDGERIDTAEQRSIAEAATAARLAEAQQQEQRERLERERQERLAAQRAERIAAAATALEQSLSGFDPAQPLPSIREVVSRRNALETLQADHPALAQVGGRLNDAARRAIEGQRDTVQALELIRATETVLGEQPFLADLRSSFEARRAAELEAARIATVNAAAERLDAALANPAALADDGARQTARRALAQLSELLEGDAAALADARRDFVTAHAEAARGLIAQQRFSVAEGVLEAAAAEVDGAEAAALVPVRGQLADAREAFRRQRAEQEQEARIEALAQRFSYEVNAGQLSRGRQTLEEYRQLAPDGELATGAGARRLAAGYLRIGRQRLDAGNVEGARQLVVTGLEVLPGDGALQSLGRDVERASLESRIAAWFGGRSEAGAGAVRNLIQQYRVLAPDDYASREAAWSSSAAGRLSGLRGDHEAYNRFLQDARSLLANPGPLASLPTILPTPPPTEELPVEPPVVEPRVEQRPVIVEVEEPPAAPQLSSADLLGRWCSGDDFEIEFEPQRMVWTIPGTKVNYQVNGYDVEERAIRVNWQDRRRGRMVFEFGEFTDARDQMVQLRGRQAGQQNWDTYNRVFLRCG